MLWIAASADEYELPLAVAESGKELATMLGVPVYSIYKNKAKGGRSACGYLVVKIEDYEEEAMKYSILESFQGYLKQTMNENTAKKYYSAVKGIFRAAVFEELDEIEPEYIEEQMKRLGSKNEFSAAKNGLLKLQEFDPTLQLPEDDFFKENAKKKQNHVKSRGQKIYKDTIMRKINRVQDPRLRLAYRLAMVSGLRISEVADLVPEDIDMSGEQMRIFVRNGKGGKSGTVTCLADEYVKERLKEAVQKASSGEALFYTAGHMENKASELGFECHDLRRIFAQDLKKKLMDAGVSRRAAEDEVRIQLRHSKQKTTSIYLRGRKVIREKQGGEPT